MVSKKDEGRYPRRLDLTMTDEMYQFLSLLAQRQRTSMTSLVRQAVRDHLDLQDELIGSRSRLGRRVTSELGRIRNDLLGQLVHLGKLILAGVIVLLSKQGLDTAEVVREVKGLAESPQLERIVRAKE
jgi:hypothetical protein